jgi:hypothetical protein
MFMRRSLVLPALIFLAGNGIARADDILLPAGTLLRCTLDEPNFSSKTAEVGDPVLCQTSATPQFGRAIFPRGAYLSGRLESVKDPGHFFGKGSLKLQFDRVGLPNMDLPFPGKVIAVRGYRVNRQGEIVGRGHATRDTVEWMFPPLWPWKVLSLPARGPRPTLKGEVPITIRLMEAVAVPQISDSRWHSFGKPSSQRLSPQSFTSPSSSSARYLSPPATGTQYTASYQAPLSTVSNPSMGRQQAQLTLIVFKSEAIYAASDYWIDEGRLNYVLSDGTEHSSDLSEVDWRRTTQLNSERGVRLALRTGRGSL